MTILGRVIDECGDRREVLSEKIGDIEAEMAERIDAVEAERDELENTVLELEDIATAEDYERLAA
jgi:hypothetical protein